MGGSLGALLVFQGKLRGLNNGSGGWKSKVGSAGLVPSEPGRENLPHASPWTPRGPSLFGILRHVGASPCSVFTSTCYSALCACLSPAFPRDNDASCIWIRAHQSGHFHLLTSAKPLFPSRLHSEGLGLGLQHENRGETMQPKPRADIYWETPPHLSWFSLCYWLYFGNTVWTLYISLLTFCRLTPRSFHKYFLSICYVPGTLWVRKAGLYGLQ